MAGAVGLEYENQYSGGRAGGRAGEGLAEGATEQRARLEERSQHPQGRDAAPLPRVAEQHLDTRARSRT